MRSTRPVFVLLAAGLLLMSVGAIAGSGTNRANAADMSRWAYYVHYDATSRVSLEQHIAQLDVVSPYWFHVTPNGDLKSFLQADVLEFMRQHEVKIVPLVQNEPKWADFHTTMETVEKREAVIAKLVTLVETYQFDGIQIDFEAINETDKAILTDFMTRLYTAFKPRGLIVSQAVAARASDASSSWGGAFDYAALAKVNDYITIMTYDYGYSGKKTPDPVAPIWWVETVVKYALTKMPREKILLGIPFYGYDWNTKTGPPAKSVSYEKAMLLAERPGAQLEYSEEDQAARLLYKDDNGDDHEVWFENAASFNAKLNLLQQYVLAGFAVWRLGHEDPANWASLASRPTPATPISPVQETVSMIYFPETGHTLAGGFLRYWRENGGLMRFGYPKTEEFTEFDPLVGKSYTVQYFERARFEWHPEFAGTEFEVLLGHIGRWQLAKRGIDPWETRTEPIPGARYFEETQHNLNGSFLAYWEAEGGLMRFGYPITEEFLEENPEDGNSYIVQYFERARFEYHPEFAGTRYEVLLGLLGNEMLRERGWIQ